MEPTAAAALRDATGPIDFSATKPFSRLARLSDRQNGSRRSMVSRPLEAGKLRLDGRLVTQNQAEGISA